MLNEDILEATSSFSFLYLLSMAAPLLVEAEMQALRRASTVRQVVVSRRQWLKC